MNDRNSYACAICGEEKFASGKWFLVTENSWEDKLRIFEWNDRLALHAGIISACSPAHVQELVIHWMATGSVAYPFARTEFTGTRQRYWTRMGKLHSSMSLPHTRTIGELMVHRESMRSALMENPGSLKSILDALHTALHTKNPADSSERGMTFHVA